MAEPIRLMLSANPVLSLSLIPKTKMKLKQHSQPHTYYKIRTSSSSSSSSSSKRKHKNLSLPVLVYKSQSQSQRSSKSPRRPLITISTTDGRWHGNWNCEYAVSLHDLSLGDLVEDHQDHNQHPLVSISLSIQKHASFGFSVDGRIVTSFTRKCCNCSSPYCRKIDVSFNVWVLQSSRENRNNIQLPDIGGDPSVIYVKPGYQADLDSLVQDTIRLNTTVKDICSESCEKSEPTIQYIGAKNSASMDKRWGRLLELRKAIL